MLEKESTRSSSLTTSFLKNHSNNNFFHTIKEESFKPNEIMKEKEEALKEMNDLDGTDFDSETLDISDNFSSSCYSTESMEIKNIWCF